MAGTYRTAQLAPGAAQAIRVTVKVNAAAAVGSRVTRWVDVDSAADDDVVDVVRFVGKRA